MYHKVTAASRGVSLVLTVIYQLAVWSRALSQVEVHRLYQLGSAAAATCEDEDVEPPTPGEFMPESLCVCCLTQRLYRHGLPVPVQPA